MHNVLGWRTVTQQLMQTPDPSNSLPTRSTELSMSLCHITSSVVILLCGLPAAFGAIRLTTDDVTPIRSFQISPDGQRIVFVTRNTDGYRVFSRELNDQDPPVLLNDSVIRDDFGVVGISPDSEWAVMRMHDESPVNSQDLFTRRIDGSGPLRNLRPDLTFINYAAASATFQIVPDTNQLVVRAGVSVEGLYSGPIDGSTELKLIANPETTRQSFFVSGDGKRVVFRSAGAWSVPVDGSAMPIEISGGLNAGNLKLTPDGHRIVFENSSTWYSAPVDGLGPLVALGAANPARNLGTRSQVTPDSNRFVFLSDQASADQFELYSRPIDASAPADRLNDPLTLGGDVANFSLSPDSQWTLFSETDQIGFQRKRFLARVDGSGMPVELNLPSPDGYGVEGVFFTPDNRSLLYTASRTEPTSEGLIWGRNYVQLLSAPIDGSAPPVLLSTNVGPDQSVADIQLTPDGEYVLFGTDPDGAAFGLNIHQSASNHALFVVPVNGGAPRIVNDPLASGEVLDFVLTPDGQNVVYRTSTSGDLYFAEIPDSISVPDGDFDDDGTWSVSDIDSLMTEIAHNSRNLAFDLTGDGIVDDLDRDSWLAVAGPRNGFAGALLIGDGNLDGIVNSADLGVLGVNWQSARNGWTEGNFSGKDVNSKDLNALAVNWQSSVPLATAVPEPSHGLLVFAMSILSLNRFRRGTRVRAVA